MIATLTPYPEMRDSGVEWLGEVPEHWNVRRLKALVEILNGATPASGKSENWGGNILWITPEDLGRLRRRDIHRGRRNITKVGYDSCGTTLAPVGSTVVSTRAPIGHLAILGRAGCTNQGCRLLVPQQDELIPPWVYLGLLTARSELQALGKGTTFAELSRDALGAFSLPLPPLPEQAAIARFLDDADRRIRRYIGAKEKLIELLEEQKQAIIHQAVTGRIDVRTGQPYPAYRDSGVEWLGQVPRHWQVRAAKWYFREVDDRSTTGSEQLLSVSHITGVTPRSEKQNVTMFMAESNVGYKLCAPGDIVVNTMWAWMSALGIARRTGVVSPSYAVYRPHRSSRLKGEYANLLLRTAAYQHEYRCRSTGIRPSRLRLYPEEFLRIGLLCPPPEEQTAIVGFLDAGGRRTSARCEAIERQIELLHEYRTRLVSDVVTGKLDVRETAANRPVADPTAGTNRGGANHTETNSHAAKHGTTKEAIP